MIGQHAAAATFPPFLGLNMQQPLYSYEDLLLQQRGLPLVSTFTSAKFLMGNGKRVVP